MHPFERNPNDSYLGKVTDASMNAVVDLVGITLEQDDRKLAVEATSMVLKTAPLFFRGKAPLLVTSGLYALDEANSRESACEQTMDFALGTAKGLAMRVAFNSIPNYCATIPGQAWGMGLASRGIESVLSRNSYVNRETRAYSPLSGLSNTARTMFHPTALGTDLIGFHIGKRAVHILDHLTDQRLFYSPRLLTLVQGSLYGASLGTTAEALEETLAGKQLSIQTIAKKSLLHGVLGGISAFPAALGKPMNVYERQPRDESWARPHSEQVTSLETARRGVYESDATLNALQMIKSVPGGLHVVELGPSLTVLVPEALQGRLATYTAVDSCRTFSIGQRKLLAMIPEMDDRTANIHADMAKMPLPSASQDLVVSRYTPGFAVAPSFDIRQNLQEVLRVLKPGGHFLVQGHSFGEKTFGVKLDLLRNFHFEIGSISSLKKDHVLLLRKRE